MHPEFSNNPTEQAGNQIHDGKYQHDWNDSNNKVNKRGQELNHRGDDWAD